jgi:PKD repeat protein
MLLKRMSRLAVAAAACLLVGVGIAEAKNNATPAQASGRSKAGSLKAWAEAEPEEGKAPLRVQFNADIEGGTPPLKIQWDFGDGSPPSSEAKAVHTYEKPGSYTATLDVDDSAADSDSDWLEIEVD